MNALGRKIVAGTPSERMYCSIFHLLSKFSYQAQSVLS